MNLIQSKFSATFNRMPPAAFKEFVSDIKKRGCLLPIWVRGKEVIDGWNRYLACQEAKIEPPIKYYKGNDPKGFVKSLNRFRRHMSGSDLLKNIRELEKTEWAPEGKPSANPANGRVSTGEVAARTGASQRTVRRAKKVMVNGSASLNAAVADGDISISKASEIADLPKKDQEKAIKEAAAKEKPDHPSTVTWAVYHAVVEEFEEMQSNYEVLADEVKTAQALLKSEAGVEMLKLRDELRVCRRSRDDAMNRAHEMKTQISFWKKQAIKLGWKPEAKK